MTFQNTFRNSFYKRPCILLMMIILWKSVLSAEKNLQPDDGILEATSEVYHTFNNENPTFLSPISQNMLHPSICFPYFISHDISYLLSQATSMLNSARNSREKAWLELFIQKLSSLSKELQNMPAVQKSKCLEIQKNSVAVSSTDAMETNVQNLDDLNEEMQLRNAKRLFNNEYLTEQYDNDRSVITEIPTKENIEKDAKKSTYNTPQQYTFLYSSAASSALPDVLDERASANSLRASFIKNENLNGKVINAVHDKKAEDLKEYAPTKDQSTFTSNYLEFMNPTKITSNAKELKDMHEVNAAPSSDQSKYNEESNKESKVNKTSKPHSKLHKNKKNRFNKNSSFDISSTNDNDLSYSPSSDNKKSNLEITTLVAASNDKGLSKHTDLIPTSSYLEQDKNFIDMTQSDGTVSSWSQSSLENDNTALSALPSKSANELNNDENLGEAKQEFSISVTSSFTETGKKDDDKTTLKKNIIDILNIKPTIPSYLKLAKKLPFIKKQESAKQSVVGNSQYYENVSEEDDDPVRQLQEWKYMSKGTDLAHDISQSNTQKNN